MINPAAPAHTATRLRAVVGGRGGLRRGWRPRPELTLLPVAAVEVMTLHILCNNVIIQDIKSNRKSFICIEYSYAKI